MPDVYKRQILKEGCLDERTGRYTTVNEAIKDATHGAVEEVTLYSIMEDPIDVYKRQTGLDLVGVLPQDDLVYEYDCEGKPSSQVPDSAPVKQALADIMHKLHL